MSTVVSILKNFCFS